MSKWLLLLAVICSVLTGNMLAQSTFPAERIDISTINKRNLQKQFEMLKSDCDWQNRIGQKIDVFWLRTNEGDFFGHVYEYIMDCDNLRLIYWYQSPAETGAIVDFMVENLEDESIYVVNKKKHLKNSKKYRSYFDSENK